jgi:hypothetical protein
VSITGGTTKRICFGAPGACSVPRWRPWSAFFPFGDGPTLADAALYGNLAMLQAGKPEHLDAIAPLLSAYRARLEANASALRAAVL